MQRDIEMRFCNQWQFHVSTVWDRTLSSKMTTLAPTGRGLSETTTRMREWRELQSSNPPNTEQVNGRISCLALAEKIWQIFHGRNPHTQLCCSSHKCMFLTTGAAFERELYRLSNGIRFIAKKHCYHREIINQTQMSLLFVLSLYVWI